MVCFIRGRDKGDGPISRARTAPTRGFALAGYAPHSGEGWRGRRACGRGGAVSGSTQLNEAGRNAGRGEAANARELKEKRGSKETAGIRTGAGGGGGALCALFCDARVFHPGGIALKAAEIIAPAIDREVAAGAGAPVVGVPAFEMVAADQAARAVPHDPGRRLQRFRGGGHAGMIAGSAGDAGPLKRGRLWRDYRRLQKEGCLGRGSGSTVRPRSTRRRSGPGRTDCDRRRCSRCGSADGRRAGRSRSRATNVASAGLAPAARSDPDAVACVASWSAPASPRHDRAGRSSTFEPASFSFRIAITCSSLNRLRFIGLPPSSI